jgi:serine protease AprX
MKRNIFLIIPFFIFNLSGFSQTGKEKKEIVQQYNQTNIKLLEKKIISQNEKKEEDINAYLLKNPTIKREIKHADGTILKIRYIINNKPIYVTTLNVNSAKSTRTDFLHNGGALGLNLEGQNMHVATWDGGPTLSTHQEFLDDSPVPVTRVTTPDQSSSNDQSDHSTHVSGTIVAKGTNASAKGMAPKATLTSFDWDFDDLEALNQATTNGLLLSNHSYGIPTQTAASLNWMMGCYNTEARTWDDVAYNAPYYLAVVSAGNDGQTTYTGGLSNNYDKLVGNKNSKNNLVVANANNPLINPNGSGNLLSLFINTSSSQGPSDDGRIKPDITADGTSVFSPISTSNATYATWSGTSMSAPNTTGTLLLLQQYYNQLNSQFMRASTLKALVCHTADDDSSVIGPDAIFGWGLLNAKKAAETILDDQSKMAVILERTLNEDETYTMSFTADSTSPLSATLCWTDPPGNDQSGILNGISPALINDLDIRLTGNSTTYFPWKLDLNNIVGFAITGDNLVDTVENIDINSPTSGNYTLTVSHKGTLTNNSQDYSIILTGSNMTLGINNEATALFGFSVWPNPAKNELNYKFNSSTNTDSNILLKDIQGRIIYSDSINSGGQIITGSINTSNFAKGLYIMTVKQGNNSYNKKVILN